MKLVRPILFAWVAALSAGCTEDTEPPAELPAESAQPVVAELTVAHAVIGLGDTTQLTVTIPVAAQPQVVVSAAGQRLPIELHRSDEGWTGQVDLTASQLAGDIPVRVVGQSAHDQLIRGALLVHASGAGGCPAGAVRARGRCVPAEQGHALSLDHFMPWWYLEADPHGNLEDLRSMNHPRAVARQGQVLVGCFSDSVGVVHLDDLFSPSTFVEHWQYRPIVAEALMEPTGLTVCQDIAVDFDRRLAVSSARGDVAGPGGLAVWSVPTLERPFQAPVLSAAYADPTGYEEVLLDGDIIYAAHKPDGLHVFRLLDHGELDLISDIRIEGLATAWGLARSGDHLYISDSGSEHLHEDGVSHFHQGGQLVVVDVREPYNPVVLGRAATQGPAKGLAALPDHVVAVASGASGVELFDVADPAHPTLLTRAGTPGTVMSVSWSDGLLGATTWSGLRLYDASERGVLRLLDATDGLQEPIRNLRKDLARALRQEFLASFFVLLQDGEVLVSEFDSLYRGRLRPEASAPRLNLHDLKLTVAAGEQTTPVTIRLSNGGRHLLHVALAEDERIVSATGPILVPPGESDYLEATVRGTHSPWQLKVVSNDAANPTRNVEIQPHEDQYSPGDPAPSFRLPAVSTCAADGCAPTGTCVDSKEELKKGRPVLLAFFSSW